MTCQEKILSNDYADLITDFTISKEIEMEHDFSFCYQSIEPALGILHIDRKVTPGFNISENAYLYYPKCYGLMEMTPEIVQNQLSVYNPLPLINSGILSVQGEPLNLTGVGVTIGFIDTGIDYLNEVFMDSSGKTRISGIWDQSIQDGEPPEGELYGTEYTKEQIQEAIDSAFSLEIVPSMDMNGHGTRMASVAAGSRLMEGNGFLGAAPNCNIAVVKLKEAKQYLRDYYLIPGDVPCYQSTDIITAIRYLQKYAITFSRPLVICLGVGTNTGAHKGTNSLSGYIDNILAFKNRTIVVAGGNEGNAGHHYSSGITLNGEGKVVEIRVAENVDGFLLELWGEVPYSYSIAIKTPGGEVIPPIYSRGKRTKEYSFIFEKTKITVDYVPVDQNSGNTLFSIRFVKPTPGIWTITVFGGGTVKEGRFQMWLPIQQFLTNDVYFLQPDPYTTLTVPAYSNNSINVSMYDNKNNSFYINSGRGFSFDNTISPDVAAPGVNISTIEGTYTGSSLAAALTAGGAAQLFQWSVVEKNDILMSSVNAKNYLIRGASREPNIEYPSREWGYGRLNVAGVFDWIAGR